MIPNKTSPILNLGIQNKIIRSSSQKYGKAKQIPQIKSNITIKPPHSPRLLKIYNDYIEEKRQEQQNQNLKQNLENKHSTKFKNQNFNKFVLPSQTLKFNCSYFKDTNLQRQKTKEQSQKPQSKSPEPCKSEQQITQEPKFRFYDLYNPKQISQKVIHKNMMKSKSEKLIEKYLQFPRKKVVTTKEKLPSTTSTKKIYMNSAKIQKIINEKLEYQNKRALKIKRWLSANQLEKVESYKIKDSYKYFV